MDIDCVSVTMDESLSHGSVSVLLHPLVIINISEHWMRQKLAKESTAVTVHGALLGKQNGREVEVLSSFELLLSEEMAIDTDFFNEREKQNKQIYPDLDFIGWYTNGGVITDTDQLFNCQMQEISESLIILKLDPLGQFGEHLPIRVYESVVSNAAQVLFKQVEYTLAQDPMERIGVDHIARASASTSSSQDSCLTAEYMLGNFQAVQMLSKRLHLLRDYVDAVISGELPPNWLRLREIRALLSRLTLIMGSSGPPSTEDSATSQTMLIRQANDVCLTTLLGGMTQTLQSLHSWFCLQYGAATAAAAARKASAASSKAHQPASAAGEVYI